ncbi:MAG: polymerase III, gamma/tau subunit, DNA polymerase III subunit gamma/tau protein [Microgenomates group bacterium GW2011_GWC1_38_14]|nr:MAG: polymerase III, gamma/tau subunit, DNA polymerase III subunit gamma/tau protein [Microgenomates group bacterium GW2011_GWC1_38_14]
MPLNTRRNDYIIDEVHMLTTEAFNALLKTLEEPPSHAIFILCTTDPQKVPATITSRCFTLSFEKASLEDLVHSFNRIVKGEGIVADPQALEAIARRADSSFRDGAKILEEVASGSKKITTKIVEEKLNTQIVSSNIDSFLNSLLEQKTGF